LLEPLAGLAKQFRRQGQIALRAADIDVSEVSRQLGQQSLDISAFAVTGRQPMHGKAVPQVVQPRLEAAAIAALHADLSA
jgi:hypothetical protein